MDNNKEKDKEREIELLIELLLLKDIIKHDNETIHKLQDVILDLNQEILNSKKENK